VVAAARERQVGLYGMSDFRAAGAGPPQLVLGFGQVPERAIEPGIAAVADLLECQTPALRSRQRAFANIQFLLEPLPRQYVAMTAVPWHRVARIDKLGHEECHPQ
jgi:hypothetical protein